MDGFSRRHSLVFACGLVFGICLAAAVMSGLNPGAQSANAAPAPEPVATSAATPVASPAAAPVAPAAQQAAAAQACEFDPILVAASQVDGKFPAPMDLRGADALDVPAYLAVGADAAAQKRPRDAETAFITACRVAAQVARADPVRLADAQYQLAHLYLQSLPGDGKLREAVAKRAHSLFSESVTTYGMKFGLDAERTRLAAAGLALAQQSDAALGAEADPVLAVPRVLLAERNTLQLPPQWMTTAMGGPPARKKAKPAVQPQDARALEVAAPVEAPRPREESPREESLKFDTAPKWERAGAPADDPNAP
ncbi:MAG TPA: hypothetical protein VHA82_06200 [Ramlibacter sp.]|uniref:hypothetical protein n=1 Tax=Ramlibacter sp. TaxID=1917967 RepID=UPI002BAA168A|nr:hypothetical protein [Ramlibacter sp.]HVZ43385.1 hypothetical protein [Ramlibacter sp.]